MKTMTGQLPLTFIEEKIMDLENALFFSLSDAVLKIPSCVIKVLRADELGQIWFVIPKPSQLIHAFDKTFPVKLDFFRKGRDYYMKIFGKAFLVNDPEEINNADCLHESVKQQALYNETVLIKVQMSHAEYVETAHGKGSTRTLLNQMKSKIYRWFQLTLHETGLAYQKIPAEVKYPSYSLLQN
jgi:general stress protein 26